MYRFGVCDEIEFMLPIGTASHIWSRAMVVEQTTQISIRTYEYLPAYRIMFEWGKETLERTIFEHEAFPVKVTV